MLSVGYKLASKLLIDKVSPYLPTIQYYQAGFMRNRSTDDQLFIVRRVLEEYWTYGFRLYAVSVDLRKAFDFVDLSVVPAILRERNVPHCLINRVIKLCLQGTTRVLWNGQQTADYVKSRGIKQGCGVSPFIFNILMDYVILKMRDVLLENNGIRLDIGSSRSREICLPLVLAYADDVIFLCKSEAEMSHLMSSFVEIIS